MKRLMSLLLVFMTLQLSGCSNAVKEGLKEIKNEDNKYVAMVKNGHPVEYPEAAYGENFEDFFGSPSWKYFKSDKGIDVVEFTGTCMYQEVEVKARLQFILDVEKGTFEAGALSFNDVPQNKLVTGALLSKVFEGEESKKSTQNTNPPSKKSITKEKAVSLVKVFMEKKGEYIPSIIEVDSEDDKTFTVHAYDIVGEGEEKHTATVGWYYVDKVTGKVESMF